MSATNPALSTSNVTGPIPQSAPVSNVSSLLTRLQDSAPIAQKGADSESTNDASFENQLALVRLGMASSLFYALRAKHRSTAAHALRVALVCSAWAERLGLSEEERDRIEVAALLHDVGKIGIPDRILRKPGKLTVEEQLTVDCSPRLACEILRGCTDDAALFDIIRCSRTWYDSRRSEDTVRKDAIPIGARMLFIAGAFYSMTTDHVYRSAMSRERALSELISGRGVQFDPQLVEDFCRMLEDRPEMLHRAVVNRWLVQLDGSQMQLSERGTSSTGSNSSVELSANDPDSLFIDHLLNGMHDSVAFTDAEGTVKLWNVAMETLTGITADAIVGQTWNSASLGLRSPMQDVNKTSCPIRNCLSSGIAVTQPMLLERSGGEPLQVHVKVSMVVGKNPGSHGAVIIMRDVSNEAILEQKVEQLHEKASCDPLTGVANRATFDQSLESFLKRASEGHRFSLVICDIDHFKRVNDVYGHPAGDEALVTFASLLSNQTREGDLVARYGGEEFLLLAANCDNATATKRADLIRQTIQRTSLSSLGGQSITASFGVTEFQPGDTAETIVARADRALLKAKENGRNRVVQLGTGNENGHEESNKPNASWLGWLRGGQAPVTEIELLSPVPTDLIIEKLRGFIADHGAEVVNVSETQITIKVKSVSVGRRRADHHIPLTVKLSLNETANNDLGMLTHIRIQLQPVKSRDRRHRHLRDCIGQVVASLRSYLLGEIVSQN